MLTCRNLDKSFGRLAVIKNVGLALAAGERHGIIGPNGAGKTTLFNLLGGELRPDRGVIELGGVDITRRGPDRRAGLGLARSFQKNSFFPEMTVADNLAIAVLLADGYGWHAVRSLRSRGAVRTRVEAEAEAVGLLDALEAPAAALSYGTQRQLEIGLALATRPRVLLLDEPTAGMGPQETGRMQALISGLPRDLTLIIIEHDMDVVFGLADRVTVLDRGEVLLTGSPEEVKTSAVVQSRYFGAPLP